MKVMTYHSRVLIALLAGAVLAVGLMAMVGANPAWAVEPNFAPAQHFSVGTSPTTVTNADFNGDGKVDLAAQNFGTDNVSVLLGNGNGTFQNKGDFTVGDDPTAVVSGQFNDDNADNKVDSSDFVDLAVANYKSGNVSVLLGNGDGTFGNKTDFAVGPAPDSTTGHPISLVSADFNSDGKADLAVANLSSTYISVLIGNGDGGFEAGESRFINSGANQIITDDFNGDGEADLAVTFLGTDITRGGVTVFLGNGDGTFRFGSTPLRLDGVLSVASGDFNDDGKTDIAATALFGRWVSAALGNGDGTFQGRRDFGVGAAPSAVISADFDGDGYDDMAVSNHDSDNVSVLYSNGDGSFQSAQNFAAGDGPIFVDAPDANADSHADLAVLNDTSNNVSVLLNNRPPNTSIGSGPTGTVTSRSASFTFSSSQANSSFECSLDGATFASCTSPMTVPDGGLLAEGSHTFRVRATDPTGHTDPTPATRTWTVDATAPTVGTVSPINQAMGVALNTNVSATFSEAMDPSTLTTSTFTLTKQGSSNALAAQVSYDSTNKTATLDPNSDLEANASYSATIESGPDGARDAVGNPLAADKVWVFSTLDTIAPSVPVIASPAEGSVLNVRSFAVSGTAEANSTVELFDGTTSKGTAQANASGQWSITLSGVSDGSHPYTATAEDAAGNVSEKSIPRTVGVDATAPAVPSIAAPADNSFDTDGTITVSGTAEPNSTVEVFEATASGNISKDTTPVDASGNWTKTISGVSNGSHTYKAKAIDAAGNTSGFSNSRTVVVDTIKPQVSSTTPPTPLAGATNVGRGTNLTATFSEKMRDTSINKTTFKLYRVNPDGTTTQITNVVVSLSTDGLKATLNPFGSTTTLLARNTRYKGVVTTGARDLAGNALAQQRSWTFTTRS